MFAPPISEDAMKNIFERVKKRFETPPKIAIAGLGEVGKGLLFRAIYGKDAERVSLRTDSSQETADLECFGIDFTDTPGIGTARFSSEKVREMRVFDHQDAVIHVLNGAASLTEDDERLHELIEQSDTARVTVVNKSDLLNEQEQDVYAAKITERLGLLPKDVVFVSAKTGSGMSQLIHHIAERLPEGLQDAFVAKQQADISIKENRIKKMVLSKATLCAGTGIIPIPVADIFIMTPIQISMVATIGYFYGAEMSKARILEMIATLGAGVGLRETARQLLKMIPGYGQAISASIAFAGTVALGETANVWFKHGMNLGPEKLRGIFQRTIKQAREEYAPDAEHNQELRDRIEALREQLRVGVLTQEEFDCRLAELLDEQHEDHSE